MSDNIPTWVVIVVIVLGTIVYWILLIIGSGLVSSTRKRSFQRHNDQSSGRQMCLFGVLLDVLQDNVDILRQHYLRRYTCSQVLHGAGCGFHHSKRCCDSVQQSQHVTVTKSCVEEIL